MTKLEWVGFYFLRDFVGLSIFFSSLVLESLVVGCTGGTLLRDSVETLARVLGGLEAKQTVCHGHVAHEKPLIQRSFVSMPGLRNRDALRTCRSE